MEKTSGNIVKIPKEEIKKLKSLKGEIIGTGFIEDVRFILENKGKKGLAKMEEAMAELGCPKYGEIEDFKWYPVGCYLITLLLAKELFGWSEEMFQKMGANAVKVSLITKIMMRYFVSIRRCFEQAPRSWKMYFTAGEFEPIEINEKEKYLFLLLKDFPGHQTFCRYMEGFLKQVVSYIVEGVVECREIECVLKGEGKGHLFEITWTKQL